VKPVEENLTDEKWLTILVIETAPEEDLIEENLASGLFLIWFIRPYFDLSNYKYQMNRSFKRIFNRYNN
jgi:S-DNA-T family DNA segregation ATPase FtsK/SpoIIIE